MSPISVDTAQLPDIEPAPLEIAVSEEEILADLLYPEPIPTGTRSFRG